MTDLFTDVFTGTFGAPAPAPVPVVAPTPLRTPWRFLYGPPQPTGGWSGEFAQAQSRTLTMRAGAGNNHEAAVDIDGRTLAAAAFTEFENDMQVLYGSQVLFAGRIAPTADTLDASAHRVAVTALDYREVLRRRAIYAARSWTNIEQATIAWNMITTAQALAGGDLGIAQGAGNPTGITQTYSAAAGDMTGEKIDKVAQTDGGFDWDITPYGTSDLRFDVFYPGRGGDRGVILDYGGALVSSITRSVDPSAYADAVYVTGDSSLTLTPQALAAPGIATRPEGRWDKVVGTSLKTQSSLNSKAAWYLTDAEVLVPTYTIQLYPGAWQGPDHIWIGDTVTVRIRSGRLDVNDQVAVSEMDFSVGPDNIETLTLTAGRVPWRLYQQIPLMLRRLRDLETR